MCWCNTTSGSGPFEFISSPHYRASLGRIATTHLTVVQPPQAYTSTPSVLPPPVIPIVGITCSAPVKSVGESVAMVSDPQDVSQPILIPEHCSIVATLVPSTQVPSTSSTFSDPSIRSTSCPIVVVPELAISAEVYPENINKPGGGKDYLCHLCSFRHSNLDYILTHVRKPLDITIGCPGCGKGYQNVASLCKHGREVHNIEIMASLGALPTAKY